MNNKNKCYAALIELSDNALATWPIGIYTRHLQKAGAIVEFQVLSLTCLRIRFGSDSGTGNDTIVQFDVNHAAKEADAVYHWLAKKVTTGESRGYVRELERHCRWAKDECDDDAIKLLTA